MTRVRVLAAVAVLAAAAGGAAYAVIEHVPVTTGWYWAVETGTTVGYGDVTPRTPAGRLAALLVMLVLIPLLGALFAAATSAHIGRQHRLGELRDIAEKAHRIAADTHRELTGRNHPDAPG